MSKTENLYEMQDYLGNVFYPNTVGRSVFMDNGRTCEEDMPEMIKNQQLDSDGYVGDILSSHLTIGTRDAEADIGPQSFSTGTDNAAHGRTSSTFGSDLLADDYNVVIGKFNKTPTPSGKYISTGDLMIVGCGQSDSSRSNAFRVAASGKCYSKQSIISSGADYAEYFEWKDGNPGNTDRRGLFVALDGDKIVLASAESDNVLGVISGNASMEGNACSEEWHDQYLHDVFGTPIMKDGAFVVNPEYNPNKEYIPRENRPEWGLVGMLGQIVVCDDGTCQVNGYCSPKTNGIATTSNSGFRVMCRIDGTHIKVLYK